MSETREAIVSMISTQPMTKRQMANRLNISSKTVSNHLVEIHKDAFHRKNGLKNSQYAFLNSSNAPRKYALISRGSLPKSWRVSGQSFRRSQETRLSSQTYPAVIFET
jgi:DNA-binding CsgD family transcriptional regulator